MSISPNDPRWQACLRWRTSTTDVVEWLEKRANLPIPTSQKRLEEQLEEVPKLSAQCHALRAASIDLIGQLTKGSHVAIKTQPIFDFIDGLDAQLENLPTHLFDVQPLWTLQNKAWSAIETMKSEALPLSQADPAKNGDTVPVPIAPNTYDKARVAELIKLGYVTKTQREMNSEFQTSTGGSNEDVGRRAQEDGSIEQFECHGGKLWVLPSDKTTLGMQDKKPSEQQI